MLAMLANVVDIVLPTDLACPHIRHKLHALLYRGRAGSAGWWNEVLSSLALLTSVQNNMASHTCLARKHTNLRVDAYLIRMAFLTKVECTLHTWFARVVKTLRSKRCHKIKGDPL